jgi:hypothetical protein
MVSQCKSEDKNNKTSVEEQCKGPEYRTSVKRGFVTQWKVRTRTVGNTGRHHLSLRFTSCVQQAELVWRDKYK